MKNPPLIAYRYMRPKIAIFKSRDAIMHGNIVTVCYRQAFGTGLHSLCNEILQIGKFRHCDPPKCRRYSKMNPDSDIDHFL
jgi:hypothetical protein